jgi:DHA1 family bicyclomycin/chloramphenicol resistance-like MFS transporter
MSLSFISASQLNSILLRKFSSEQMIFALIVQSVISITFLIASINHLRIVSNNWYAVYFLSLFGYF